MTRSLSVVPALLAVLLVVAGCDASFSAFDPDDTLGPYSVFGYLDATADTQYVRVELLRDSLLVGTSENSAGARVTLENVDTGETVVMRDSLFEIGNSLLVRNFYTTGAVEPEETYRFRAVPPGSDEATTAVVSIPEDFPEPTVADVSRLDEGIVSFRIEGVERLGAVVSRYFAVVCTALPSDPPVCAPRLTTASHLEDARRMPDGTYLVEVNWQQSLGSVASGQSEYIREVIFARFTVASASEDWPDFGALTIAEQAEQPQPPPNAEVTNIEQGTGFLGGAVTKTVPIPLSLSDLQEND